MSPFFFLKKISQGRIIDESKAHVTEWKEEADHLNLQALTNFSKYSGILNA